MPESNDPADRESSYTRDAAELSRLFHVFGRFEAPQLDSPMYAELSYGVSQDPELLDLACQTRLGQPPPNMLFAAAQYLLLSGEAHDLRVHYPALTGRPRPPIPAFPAFRDFCLQHRKPIVDLLRTRLTQTNVILRSACLLPAFAQVHRETSLPLALIEVGSSAGLNMNWDRYHYHYLNADGRAVAAWGDRASPIVLRTTLRGPRRLNLPDDIPVAWRIGVDLNPIDTADDDQVRWLRALIWPEHVERHGQMTAAIRLARQYPQQTERGDAVERLPELLARTPATSAVVVYATFALYQMTREQRLQLLKAAEQFAMEQGRRVDLISIEGAEPDHSPIRLYTYHPDGRTTRQLGRANPHGYWLEWLAQ